MDLDPREKLKVTLEYKGKRYCFLDEGYRFMWEEGNFSCDCNKSLFIQRNCDPTFPEMKCGDEIKLISLEAEA